MGDTESCSSRAVDFVASQSRSQRQKIEVYNEVFCRLKESDEEEASLPGFEDELWAHFYRLPTRYALDVNAERAQDVLMHKKLLQMAHSPATRPAIEVRVVQVHSVTEGNCRGLDHVDSPRKLNVRCSHLSSKQSHPPPAFGPFPDFDTTYEAQNSIIHGPLYSRLMHEITISTKDKPKLLSELTSLLSEIELNIQEAHAFSTIDGYSLDVFVVDNWASEETEQLRNVLAREIPKIELEVWLSKSQVSTANLLKLTYAMQKYSSSKSQVQPVIEQQQSGIKPITSHVMIPADQIDVWEIDTSLLRYENKIASGSYGDMYKGTFCSQDVAIKVLRTDNLNDKQWREFAQEVFIMRKVRHKNVVQFIGASTRPPSLCIVTEYMSGGSVYDFLHKKKGRLDFPFFLRVAIDVSKGVNYLHQNNIIHRDLKAANLLMDENGVVKVADFGVARVKDQSGVMTAETGTYRWMAPEVIEHKPYDHKADVFSFGIFLWELLTGKLPYEHLTPLQAAVGVVQQVISFV
ncbi:hypothetical protein K2173_027855 [Erythroxylum novogranatense]|uniref:non-specific serine/threonine protein kinase n=1 Tax=Erythroxylum novogranatense TaxID=1862640 RepID=A0AAV8U0G6_9ROSI|nr:hypothetical protein K2173_027855 [Erythroxylum novogranatense]